MSGGRRRRAAVVRGLRVSKVMFFPVNLRASLSDILLPSLSLFAPSVALRVHVVAAKATKLDIGKNNS